MPENEAMPSPERKSSAGILPEKYPDLHTSKEVSFTVDRERSRGEKIPNNPQETVSRYLGSLLNKHGLMGGDPERQRRQISRHVIKPHEIPDGYFENQRRIARELGHGDIDVTPEMRRLLTEAVVADQTKSFENWVEYINHPDANYPSWFRYYTIRSVLQTGPYDKEKHQFAKRSRSTTAPYIDLNREALAYVYDQLNNSLEGRPIERADDETLKTVLKSKNFGRLYAFAIEKVTPASREQRQQIQGEWIKYDQGDDEEGRKRSQKLARSLQGHGTGWCTAGESTAEMQLAGGDFYVYKSFDDEGKPTIPRIAIRMEEGQVAEVRGINAEQNLEGEMVEKTEEKLATLPGGAEYKQKAANMKQLTQIEKKTKADESLTSEELHFLYEIDRPIQGFGYQKDLRITEIRQTRNTDEDMPVIFECEKGQIARSSSEINASTKAYVGSLEPGIFDKLHHIEHVYTSFPEGVIRRQTIEIGGKTAKELEREMEQQGVNISSYAKDMLRSKDFTPLRNPEDIDLVRLKVGDLGLSGVTITDQIYTRAKELGLDLCPAEVGPQYRLKYKDQPMGERFYIGMKQIADSHGNPYVFFLVRDGDGLWLYDSWAGPGDAWRPVHGFVFSLRKSDS